jgi:hypothetical protein
MLALQTTKNQKPNRTHKMKQTLTTSQAAQILIDDENANWSSAGAYALVEYLEEREDDCGEEIEFCYVAIRCDYSEYESIQKWGENYFGGWSSLCEEFGDDYCGPLEEETPEEYAERFDDAMREYIQERGLLLEFDGGIIVSSF